MAFRILRIGCAQSMQHVARSVTFFMHTCTLASVCELHSHLADKDIGLHCHAVQEAATLLHGLTCWVMASTEILHNLISIQCCCQCTEPTSLSVSRCVRRKEEDVDPEQIRKDMERLELIKRKR